MKKIVIICVVIILVLLASIFVCYTIDMNKIKNNEPVSFSTWGLKYAPPVKTHTFTGKIIETNGKNLLISPDDNEDIRKSADKISVSTSDNINWKVGTKVSITYDGYVMETYPAKVNLINIQEIQIDKVEKMYRTIIDNLMGEDQALNYEAKYIALDLDSFVTPYKDNKNNYLSLSKDIKNNLLEYCKKYNSEIKYASFDDLKSEGLFNEKTVSLDGILIYVSNVEKMSENKAIISMTKYRSGLGAIFPKYELNYKNNNWEIKVLEMAIS